MERFSDKNKKNYRVIEIVKKEEYDWRFETYFSLSTNIKYTLLSVKEYYM